VIFELVALWGASRKPVLRISPDVKRRLNYNLGVAGNNREVRAAVLQLEVQVGSLGNVARSMMRTEYGLLSIITLA
jgi:hypothetical protein